MKESIEQFLVDPQLRDNQKKLLAAVHPLHNKIHEEAHRILERLNLNIKNINYQNTMSVLKSCIEHCFTNSTNQKLDDTKRQIHKDLFAALSEFLFFIIKKQVEQFFASPEIKDEQDNLAITMNHLGFAIHRNMKINHRKDGADDFTVEAIATLNHLHITYDLNSFKKIMAACERLTDNWNQNVNQFYFNATYVLGSLMGSMSRTHAKNTIEQFLKNPNSINNQINLLEIMETIKVSSQPTPSKGADSPYKELRQSMGRRASAAADEELESIAQIPKEGSNAFDHYDIEFDHTNMNYSAAIAELETLLTSRAQQSRIVGKVLGIGDVPLDTKAQKLNQHLVAALTEFSAFVETHTPSSTFKP